MADSSSGSSPQGDKNLPLHGSGIIRLSSIIPAVEEIRKQRPPFIPSVGLPQITRSPQEQMVERVMENCAFKSILAGVLGKFHANR